MLLLPLLLLPVNAAQRQQQQKQQQFQERAAEKALTMQRDERAVEQSRGHVEESKAKTLNTHRHIKTNTCAYTYTHI